MALILLSQRRSPDDSALVQGGRYLQWYVDRKAEHAQHPAVKDYDLSSLHAIMSGAAPLSPELTNQVAKILPQVCVGQGYGMTETSTTVSFPQIDQKICTPGSGGRLLPGVVARVVKPDGSLAGFNEPGHLIVKGPANALRYMNNEEA